MELLDTDGRTGEEFLRELFEYEFCPDCGGDAEDHTPVPLLGNFFALCREERTE